MKEEIKKLSCTTRQKNILQIIYEFNEGWRSEESLEAGLEKLFVDKRNKPKKLNMSDVNTCTFSENQEVTYKGKKYFFKEYNPKNGKILIANAKSVRYHVYNDWWVNSTDVV